MKKLFSYSRIAALVMLVSALLCTACIFTEKHILWSYSIGYLSLTADAIESILAYVALFIFFIMLLSNSTKGSQIRTPAIIGIIALLIALPTDIFNLDHAYATMESADFYQLVRYLLYISGLYAFLLMVALIWLSTFFSNKLITILGVAAGLTPMIIVVFYTVEVVMKGLYEPWIWTTITTLNAAKWFFLAGFLGMFSTLSNE